jgi:hypothetical protein
VEQIITVIIAGVCGIITAGFVIAFLHKKTKELGGILVIDFIQHRGMEVRTNNR